MTGASQAIVDCEIADTMQEFSNGLLATLPNQSLQDALRSSATAIRTYLEALPTFYTLQ